MIEGIEFPWDPAEFDTLLDLTQYDEALNISLGAIKGKDAKILEAGCGGGRVVKYLHDLGYINAYGIELGISAVAHINNRFPNLKIIQGDILSMPYPQGEFDLILSFGVVEHFMAGLELPLSRLKEVLKPGGVAMITVPSQNILRRIIDLLNLEILGHNGRSSFRKCKWPQRNKSVRGYYVYPKYGEFFEYRLTPREFESACLNAGFEIIQSVPTCHDDGMFHVFGAVTTAYKDKVFHHNLIGRIANRLLKMIPFCHNHMHACLLRRK